jgi:hypothetical protein
VQVAFVEMLTQGLERSRLIVKTRAFEHLRVDLAPDGKRVVVVTPVASADAPKQEHEVVFLQNFFDELRRRVPLGK